HLDVPPAHREQVGAETVGLGAWLFYARAHPPEVPDYAQAALHLLRHGADPPGPSEPGASPPRSGELMDLDLPPVPPAGRNAPAPPRPADWGGQLIDLDPPTTFPAAYRESPGRQAPDTRATMPLSPGPLSPGPLSPGAARDGRHRRRAPGEWDGQLMDLDAPPALLRAGHDVQAPPPPLDWEGDLMELDQPGQPRQPRQPRDRPPAPPARQRGPRRRLFQGADEDVQGVKVPGIPGRNTLPPLLGAGQEVPGPAARADVLDPDDLGILLRNPFQTGQPGSAAPGRGTAGPGQRPDRHAGPGQVADRTGPVATTPPERPAAVRFPATPDPAEEQVGTTLQLFAGAGVLTLASEEAGLRAVAVNEYAWAENQTLLGNRAAPFDRSAAASGSLRDPWPLVEGDVRAFDFSPLKGWIDGLVGSTPCPDWSEAARGRRQGEQGQRNLWPEFLRVVRETEPKWAMSENVSGMLEPDNKPYFDYVLRQLAAPFVEPVPGEDWRVHDQRVIAALQDPAADPAQRYDVQWVEVDAADYGVPQNRRRVFVVAIRRDLGLPRWKPPQPTHSRLALWHSQQSGEYWRRHPGVTPRPEQVPDHLPRADGKKSWVTIRDAIAGLPAPRNPADGDLHPSGWLHHYSWPGAREYSHQPGSDPDAPSRTITTNPVSAMLRLDDGTVRFLTVAEVKQLVGLPKWWWLAGSRQEQIAQLGNAVPALLARAFADSIVATLRSGGTTGPAPATRPPTKPGPAQQDPEGGSGGHELAEEDDTPPGPATLPSGLVTTPAGHQLQRADAGTYRIRLPGQRPGLDILIVRGDILDQPVQGIVSA
ncbi:MAG TPA: DNA cytosine methyltransferase, partial [Streptosporangiaceae bacterium]|nr:DNA cytosine methyltransferase [Streptosporangiaceae bacterium]